MYDSMPEPVEHDIEELIREYKDLMERKTDFELKMVSMLAERKRIDNDIKWNLMNQKTYYIKH